MKALLIVDVQNDFLPGGALAAPQGDKIIPVINKLIDSNNFDFIVASKDWHPRKTIHFNKWPVHCVQNTNGAELSPDLKTDKIDLIALKGTSNKDDGYSAFEATNINLSQTLKNKGINDLYVTGIATEYCVLNTVLDALKHNFKVFLITDAIKGVNVKEGDDLKAINQMKSKGAIIIKSKDIR